MASYLTIRPLKREILLSNVKRPMVYVLVFSLFMFFVPGRASGLGIDWIIDVSTIASDNLDRAAPSSEEAGQIYSLSSGARLRDSWGRTAFNAELLIGEEVERGIGHQFNSTYSFLADLNIGSTVGLYVGLSTLASQSTVVRDEDSIDRSRDLETRSQFTLLNGSRYQSGNWEIAVDGNWVESGGDDTQEVDVRFKSSWMVGALTEFGFNAETLEGEEIVSKDRWSESSAGVTVTNRVKGGSSYGANINWSSSDSEPGQGGNRTHVSNTSLDIFWINALSRKTTIEHQVGIDLTTVDDSDEINDPTGSLTILHQLSALTQGTVRGSYSVERLSGEDETPVWINRALLDASLNWQAGNDIRMTPAIAFGRDDYIAGELAGDRVDEIARAEVEMAWEISGGISGRVSLLTESVESSLDINDIKENRLEIGVTGVIF